MKYGWKSTELRVPSRVLKRLTMRAVIPVVACQFLILQQGGDSVFKPGIVLDVYFKLEETVRAFGFACAVATDGPVNKLT